MSDSSKLATFIANCNPSDAPPDDAYVDRPSAITPRLLLEVTPSERSRVLLLGQTGVGKSTELRRLAQSAGAHYLPIAAPVDRYLDLANLSWHEILVFSVAWALEKVRLDGTPTYRALSAALTPIETVRTEVTTHGETVDSLIGGRLAGKPTTKVVEKTVGGPPAPTATQRFRNDSDEVRQTISSGKAQFWDLAVAGLRLLEQAKGHPPLLLIDGLEKMPTDAAKGLFYDARRYLEEWPSRAVITAPLALSFESYFGEVEEQFLHTERLRAISCLDGEPGFDFFQHLVTARGGDGLFASEVLHDMISWGGGLPRQFIQLAVYSATRALEEGQEVIAPEHFARARQKATDRWQYQLGPTEFRALEKSDDSRNPSDRARLLRLGALVEYDNSDGSLRLDVNPLVGAILARRTEAQSA